MIQLLHSWNGYSPGPQAGFTPAEESRLVRLGLARFPTSEPTAPGLSVVPHAISLMAGFGDSLTQRAIIAGSTVVAYSGQGYLSWLQFLTMGKVWMPLVCRVDSGAAITKLVDYCKGVSGETTVDMLLRIGDITNLNPRPRFVNLLAGTNDLTQPATINDSALTIFNRWKALAKAFADAGIFVFGYTLLPRGGPGGAPGARPGWAALSDAQITTQRGKLVQLNQYIRAHCAVTPGLALVDPYQRLLDPATGGLLVSMNDTSDGIHTNDLGAFNIADEGRIAMAPFLAPGDVSGFQGSIDLYGATDNPFGSMVDGSFSVGTGGTATAPTSAGAGGVPDDWTMNKLSGGGSSTAVVQKLARADGKSGFDANIVYTGGAGGPDAFRLYKAGSTIASGNFAAGDAWQGETEVTVAATGAYAAPDLNARQLTANIYALKKYSADVPGNYSGKLRTPLIVQPDTPGALNAWHLDTIGTVCAATVNRRNLALRRYNTTLPGAVAIAA